jgi:sodium-dependent dicarboxylate transporter 2/3/5
MKVVAVLALAGGLAAAGAWAAPGDWPTGPGTITVTVGNEAVLAGPVMVGSGEEVTLGGPAGSVELPDGVPVDGAVTARVEVGGTAQVTLTLPDGAVEEIPVLREEGSTLIAVRRPPHQANVVVALLAAVVVLWVSELVPLHVTSLAIPVVLAATRTSEAGDALAPFFDPIIVLFFAGFLMAEAMRRAGLDRLVAAHVVARAGRSPVLLFATLLGGAAFASMWMSNTAAVAVLLPVALTVTRPLDAPGYQRAVVLAIAYGATIGGVGSAIGTPANPLAIKFLGEFAGREISFIEWFAFGLPLVILFLPVMGVYLWWRLGADVVPERFAAARHLAREQVAAAGALTSDQVRVLGVFLLVLAGWLTQTWHEVHPGVVALAGAVVLMVLGHLQSDDLGSISWPTLLTFGGGLSLGLALIDTGASDWLVTRLAGVSDWPQWLGLAAIACAALAMTTVASNTAAAATLVPLAIPLAGLVGADPVQLVVVVALASSIDFALVIGTPPTMLAYGTGLFNAREILRLGIWLDLIGLALLLTAVTSAWQLLGVT